jgi:hypothetical protein
MFLIRRKLPHIRSPSLEIHLMGDRKREIDELRSIRPLQYLNNRSLGQTLSSTSGQAELVAHKHLIRLAPLIFSLLLSFPSVINTRQILCLHFPWLFMVAFLLDSLDSSQQITLVLSIHNQLTPLRSQSVTHRYTTFLTFSLTPEIKSLWVGTSLEWRLRMIRWRAPCRRLPWCGSAETCRKSLYSTIRKIRYYFRQCVVDPWHFGTDPIWRSVPLIYGPGSCFICQWLTRCQQKKSFFKVFLRNTVLFGGTITSVFIDEKSKRSYKRVKMKVFLSFVLVDGRIRIHGKWWRIRIREVDPDSHIDFRYRYILPNRTAGTAALRIS